MAEPSRGHTTTIGDDMTDAFGKALQAITEDGDAAFLFSQRDFSPLGDDHGLNDEQLDLIQAAAEDADEVAGFQFNPNQRPDADGYYTYELTNIQSVPFQRALSAYALHKVKK